MGRFPEEIRLVRGNLVYHIRQLFFYPVWAKEVIAVLGEGGEIEFPQSLLETRLQHRSF